MNKKTLPLLIAAALIATAAAFLAVHRQDASTSASIEVEPLFPELKKHINDVASIEVTRPGGEVVTADLKGDTWTYAEKGGYPMRLETLRTLLLQVGDLQTVEPKTKDAKLHDRLELLDPAKTKDDAKEGVGTRIVAKDKAGKELAAVIVGKRKPAGQGASQELTFVRRAGDDQTWLAMGGVRTTLALSQWVDTQILTIDRNKLSEIDIERPDGKPVKLSRPNADARDYALADIPEGYKVSQQSSLNTIPSRFSYLSFQDALPVADVDFATSPVATTVARTFDGLIVTVTQAEQDGHTYAKIEASVDEDVVAAREAEAAAKKAEAEKAAEEAKQAAEEAAAAAAASGEEAAPEAPPVAVPTPEAEPLPDVRAEAADLNAKLAAWAFTFPAAVHTDLSKEFDTLIVEAPPEPEPTPTPAPDLEGLPLGAAATLPPDDLQGILEGWDGGTPTPGDGGTAAPIPSPEAAPTASPESAAPEVAPESGAVEEGEAKQESATPNEEATGSEGASDSESDATANDDTETTGTTPG